MIGLMFWVGGLQIVQGLGLSQIAKDVLEIHVSTVASEFAFSAGGRVVYAFRSSLTPTMVEALIYSQQWLKATGMDENYIRKFDVEVSSSYFSDLELCTSVEQGTYALHII